MSAGLVEGRQVMFCLPWYKQTNPRTSFALLSMMDRRRMALSLDFGDAFVAHARNKLAKNFLKSGMEWACFVDDDNVPPFGNAALYNSFTGFNLPDKFAGMHGVDRLLSHRKTLVGGLYRGRWPHSGPVFGEGTSAAKWLEDGPRDELRPTQWVGFGFVLIHRSVFLDIQKCYPRLEEQWFTSSEHDLARAVDIALNCKDLEEAMRILREARAASNRVSNLGAGEDVQFCRRAAQAGHPCFVDFGCIVGHLGEYCYGYGTDRKVL